MSRIICAVFGDSPDYVNRFLMYFKNHRKSAFDVIGFTSQKALEEYLSDSMVDILLLSRDHQNRSTPLNREEEPDRGIPALRSENIREIVYLGEQQDLNARPRHIDRYRPMTQISQDISLIARELQAEDRKSGRDTFDAAAIYSVTRESDPFDAALKLLDRYPDEAQTLYIDLDMFSALQGRIFETPLAAMSEVIFAYLSDAELFKDTINASVIRHEGLAVLMAQTGLRDLDEISALGWHDLLKEIARAGGFTRLIINISDSCRDLLGMLSICDDIYIVCAEGSPYARLRAAAFRKYFEDRGRTDITDRFRQTLTERKP